MRYRYIGTVSNTLASGRPLSLGDEIELNDTQEAEAHNAWLIESGRLQHLKQEPSTKSRGTTKKISKETDN